MVEGLPVKTLGLEVTFRVLGLGYVVKGYWCRVNCLPSFTGTAGRACVHINSAPARFWVLGF